MFQVLSEEKNGSTVGKVLGKEKMIHDKVGGVRTGQHRKDNMGRLEIVHSKLSSTLFIVGKI